MTNACHKLAGVSNRTERAGNSTCICRNLLRQRLFDVNPLTKRCLARSGWCRTMPVVPGWEGVRPGQIRDKLAQVMRSNSDPPSTAPAPIKWPRGALGLVVARRRGPTARRKGPRSRREVEAERQRLLEETGLAIDAIAAEFHARLPREQARSVGAAYARYSSRFQHSVADQVRGLLEAALAQGIFVPREFVFYDLAVRGAKNRRPGLDGLRAVLKRKAVQVLLIFTTNRLFRKTYTGSG